MQPLTRLRSSRADKRGQESQSYKHPGRAFCGAAGRRTVAAAAPSAANSLLQALHGAGRDAMRPLQKAHTRGCPVQHRRRGSNTSSMYATIHSPQVSSPDGVQVVALFLTELAWGGAVDAYQPASLMHVQVI